MNKNLTTLQSSGRSLILEKWFAPALFALIAVFTLIDVVSDVHEGAPASHLSLEIAIASVSLLGFLYFLLKNRRLGAELSRENMRSELAEIEANAWRTRHIKLSRGLAEAIDQQLSSWKLTGAERDVALFLLKGFSADEIAALRKASVKTIKQQCSAVYAKSNLKGRAELAAFFLEDILIINSLDKSSTV